MSTLYYKKKIINGKQTLIHRHLMEEHIGRKLKDGEAVHHINGNRKDNRIENLQLMTIGEHSRLHISSNLKSAKKRTTMIRYNIYLSKEQFQFLKLISYQDITVSEHVRRAIDFYKLGWLEKTGLSPSKGGDEHERRKSDKPDTNNPNTNKSSTK